MTRIGIVGDTHGSIEVTSKILRSLRDEGLTVIHHVGDFGFWPGVPGSLFLSEINTLLSELGQTLYVTPGNHEDYNQIKGFRPREDGWLVARTHILVAPRGHRWSIGDTSFVSLGGAPSVDRAWRVRAMRQIGIPIWWKDEDISREDIDRTVSGGRADVMIAHDAPHGVPGVEQGIAGNPSNFTEEDLEYALEGRLKMKEAVDIVRPKVFFHGHYHWKVDDSISIFNEDTGLDDTTRVLGLASDGAPYSSGILDTETLDFTFME